MEKINYDSKFIKRYNSLIKLLLTSGATPTPNQLRQALKLAFDAKNLSLFKLYLKYGAKPSNSSIISIFTNEDTRYRDEVLKFFPKIIIFSQPLNRFIKLDGKKYPLSMLIIEYNKSLIIIIPFPDNYPQTDFRKNSNFIGHVNIIVKKKGIYIATFFINTYPEGDFYESFKVRKGEREGTKGVGKTILCTGLNLLSQKKRINDETRVDLVAGGARCLEINEDYLIEIKEKIREKYPQKYEEIIEKKENWYQEYFRLFFPKLYPTLKPHPSFFPYFYCQMKDNFNLTQYYAKYGFQIIDASNFYFIKMSARLGDILKACSD